MHQLKKHLFYTVIAALCFSSSLSGLDVSRGYFELQITPDSKTYVETLRVYTDKERIFSDVYDWTIDKEGNSLVHSNKPFQGEWIFVPHIAHRARYWDNFIEIPVKFRLKENTADELLAQVALTESNSFVKPGKRDPNIVIPIIVSPKGKEKLKIRCKAIRYNPQKQSLLFKIENYGNSHIRLDARAELFQITKRFLKKSSKNLHSFFITRNEIIFSQSCRNFEHEIYIEPGSYECTIYFRYGIFYNKKIESKKSYRLIIQ